MLASALLLSSCMNGHKKEETPVAETAAQPVVKKATESAPKKSSIKPRHLVSTEQSQTPGTGLPSPFIPKMPGKRVAQVNVPGRYVALTFDDGPSAANTPKVLDILKRHGAKATFFVVGQCAVRNKGILARTVAEGHEVGSHTWSHIKMSGNSDEAIISEMDRTNAVIAEAIGHRPVIMRPPYGATNSHVVDMMMSRYGMASILWSVDTQDWKHPGVDVVTRRVVDHARNGSIILLHDIHASTVAAVEGIVTGLQKRGFQLVTVSELMEMGRRAASEAGVATTAPAEAAEAAPRNEGLPAPEPASATAVMVSPAAAPVEAPAAVAVPAPVAEPAPAPAVPQEMASPTQDI